METRFFDGPAPEHTTAEWYAHRDRAPHLEEDWHRGRLLLSAQMVNQALTQFGLRTVSDMGCGDGGLLTLIDGVSWGYDLQPTNVKAGIEERRVDVRLGDVVHGSVEWGDVAVCTEMLEHLVDPHAFVAAIPSRVVVASSPAGETADCHYAFHTWAWDMDGYAAMFKAAGFEVVQHQVEGLFQVLEGIRANGNAL